MRRFVLFLLVAGVFLAAVNVPCLAQDFKPYAGSKLDEKGSREASAAAPGKLSEVYTTGDAFDKVLAFYKGLYKEFAMRGAPKLPSGQQIQWAFFILDGGKNLSDSTMENDFLGPTDLIQRYPDAGRRGNSVNY